MDYNKTRVGVDILDQMARKYTVKSTLPQMASSCVLDSILKPLGLTVSL